MIEVGVPFSDPMADGPVIQDAATKAQRNGMTLDILFSQLEAIKEKDAQKAERVANEHILNAYENMVKNGLYEAYCTEGENQDIAKSGFSQ